VLHEAQPKLPPGLYDVILRGLARDPDTRWQDADTFAAALAPFDATPGATRGELAQLVSHAMRHESTDRMIAVRDSERRVPVARAVGPAAAVEPAELGLDEARPSERPTGQYKSPN
jgi:hypothetical protein